MALHNVSIVDVEDFTLDDDESTTEEDEVVGDKRKRKAAKEEDITPPSPSHLSITLPCKSFHGTRTRYNITVSNRYVCIVHVRCQPCFVCI